MGRILNLKIVQGKLPDYQITESIGEGNFGYAFLTADGKVLKLTCDKREFALANYIYSSNSSFANYVDIYECKRSALNYKGNSYHLILQEKVDTGSKQLVDFVKAFKKVWLSDEMIGKIRPHCPYLTFDDFRDCLLQDKKDIIEYAMGKFCEKYPYFLHLYDNLCNAVLDLAKFCQIPKEEPCSSFMLDLNDGNLGLDSHGALKLFDQLIDPGFLV